MSMTAFLAAACETIARHRNLKRRFCKREIILNRLAHTRSRNIDPERLHSGPDRRRHSEKSLAVATVGDVTNILQVARTTKLRELSLLRVVPHSSEFEFARVPSRKRRNKHPAYSPWLSRCEAIWRLPQVHSASPSLPHSKAVRYQLLATCFSRHGPR